ncbi:related to Putative nicotinamide N-methyltransferase [Cephalotrichum gorgonifer]|uniref:Related to Putative nicotinamide N-methyltransferase n=1 Tax=Cephalotrichum gorgonifer TaxID=2041049 RepID=A0AAE8SXR3_9PEZI|nr:related to Putative nicotinamide N-methyltransferase [Cephalotrichum gorgonifer]
MTAPTRPTGAELRSQLATNGYVVVRSIFTPTHIAALREAASRAEALGRDGTWPNVRIVGKQFPPWDPAEAKTKGIWGVQHLLNPALPDSKAYAEVYFSEEIISVARDLLECGDDELVMELFNMLVRPESEFALRWHRDDVGPEATAEEELERLAEPAWHAQYNLALYDDASLVVVPGSHSRARTNAERSADPYEKDMPDQLFVELGPGDIVFYDNNILHRGVYDATKDRATLHGSIGHVKGKGARARNVLQHGIGSWVENCRFDELDGDLRTRAEGMRERLMKMGQAAGKVEYSQTD